MVGSSFVRVSSLLLAISSLAGLGCGRSSVVDPVSSAEAPQEGSSTLPVEGSEGTTMVVEDSSERETDGVPVESSDDDAAVNSNSASRGSSMGSAAETSRGSLGSTSETSAGIDSTGYDDGPWPADCVEVSLFNEGFEAGDGAWNLDSLWTVVPSFDPFEGDQVLRGYWENFDVGCSVSSVATTATAFDLSSVVTARLMFWHFGAVCDFDEVWVEVIEVASGSRTRLVPPVPSLDTWQGYEAELTPWVGAGEIRIEIGFENVCDDPCGVDWSIDEVRICGAAPEG